MPVRGRASKLMGPKRCGDHGRRAHGAHTEQKSSQSARDPPPATARTRLQSRRRTPIAPPNPRVDDARHAFQDPEGHRDHGRDEAQELGSGKRKSERGKEAEGMGWIASSFWVSSKCRGPSTWGIVAPLSSPAHQTHPHHSHQRQVRGREAMRNTPPMP